MTRRELSEFFPANRERWQAELIRSVFDARRDHQKFLSFFHDDAVITIVGQIYDYSFGGVYRGHQNILCMLRRIHTEVETSDMKFHNLVVDGDKIGFRRSMRVRHHGTAAARRLFLGGLMTLRDGKIADFHEYVDTLWLKQLSGDVD